VESDFNTRTPNIVFEIGPSQRYVRKVLEKRKADLKDLLLNDCADEKIRTFTPKGAAT
jgi:hypothetical protein